MLREGIDMTTEYQHTATLAVPEPLIPDAAQWAFDSLQVAGGIRLGVNVDPHSQFAEWGLTPIKMDEEL